MSSERSSGQPGVSDLQNLLDAAVAAGDIPGAVALISRGDDVEVAVAGVGDLATAAPMTRASLFRWASITKPVTAAAVMMLVDDGVFTLDDPVATWLPEIASPTVVTTPASPVDDVVPATRPISVLDLLTNRAGWGFPSDFTLPQVQSLFTVQADGREVQQRPDPSTWLAALAAVPMLYQPGEAWLYDTSSDLQGVLVARASGATLPEFLHERIFAPLGMTTAFVVPPDRRPRFTTSYRRDAGGFALVDPPDGRWSTLPAFPSGGSGLVGTVDDWHRFARLLLGGGTVDGRRLLSSDAVLLMTTNHLTPAQREIGELFLDGQGWGFGGAVDIAATDPWTVPGRYGWVGGTGTSAHITASTDTVAILLTQVAADDPVAPGLMRDFWTLAARG